MLTNSAQLVFVMCYIKYKIYSKVLANRLKKLLPSIITDHQSTFAKDRLILDNIFVAFDTLIVYGNKIGYEAYDRVNWDFQEKLIRLMGFNGRWIHLFMGCVKTILYSVLVNGEPCGMIQPTRGIRQGDPLSPFLFLLCTEGLNGLIKRAKNNGDIHRFYLCKRGPKLTRLLFTNDSLLFCRAIMEECGKVLEILNMYEEASGQKVNRSKTALFFSKCTLT